jgi:SHS2 domain-containing protein
VPYEELSHTADWSLRAWAPSLEGLFVESARGMYALAGVRTDPGSGAKRTFAASALDAEGLLVAFLTELVYAAEGENLAFEDIRLHLAKGREGFELKAEMAGRHILSADKLIKAVTYHNLKIRTTQRGREVEIVFDV